MKSQILSLGFSPCPNDCFIFDALLHGKIDAEGIKFKPVIQDVETLNKKAFRNKLDITKLSFFAFAKVQKKYSLLDAGAALGFGVGPIVISKDIAVKIQDTRLKVAIPGVNTTANLLFSLSFPKTKNKTEVLFSKIEDEVLSGKYDLGVIIHESRFTYIDKGLKKIIDLGEWWEEQTKSPIPLGCIAIRKTFPKEVQKKVERIIRRSVEYAFANPDSSQPFVKKYSQEMDDRVIKEHINLYVNRFSVSLGRKGKNAVKLFLRKVIASAHPTLVQ